MSFENMESKTEQRKIDFSKYRSNQPFSERKNLRRNNQGEEEKDGELSQRVEATVRKELGTKSLKDESVSPPKQT